MLQMLCKPRIQKLSKELDILQSLGTWCQLSTYANRGIPKLCLVEALLWRTLLDPFSNSKSDHLKPELRDFTEIDHQVPE